jgi:hypothetical protein
VEAPLVGQGHVCPADAGDQVAAQQPNSAARSNCSCRDNYLLHSRPLPWAVTPHWNGKCLNRPAVRAAPMLSVNDAASHAAVAWKQGCAIDAVKGE